MKMNNYYGFINQRFQEFMQHQLHEISNKFNLLSLSLEDLEDALEEKTPWSEEVEQVKKMKGKFLESLNSSKRDVLFEKSPAISMEEGIALINKIKVKEMNNKLVKINFKNSKKENSDFSKTPLLLFLWNFVSIRLAILNSEEVNFSFESRESFLKDEIQFLQMRATSLEEGFKNAYLDEMNYLLDYL